MNENPSYNEQITEIRQLLIESKETLDVMRQVLETLYEISIRVLSITEREDTIFACSERDSKSSLIASKSPPGFYLETAISELKKVNDEGSA
jgi:hypothetical protein